MRTRALLTIALADLLALVAAVVVGSWGRYGHPVPWQAEPLVPLIGAMVAGLAVGSYVSARTWGAGVPRPSYGRALWIGTVMLGVTALAIVVARPFWSRGFLALTMGSWLVLALAHRAVARRRPWTEAMVVVTAEKELADHLHDADHARVLAVLDPLGDSPHQPLENGTSLVVDLRAVLSDEMARFVSSSSLAGFRVRALSTVYEEHTGRLPIVHLEEGWELTVPVGARGLYIPLKRILDVALVMAVSPLALLLGGVVAALVRLDSPGPAIFRQERVGLNGLPFVMYKFRTMREHAESEGSHYPTPGDPRLTRAGRFLRRYRLDELPQLWNVLRGEVSLVGPRPEWTVLAARYAETIPFYTHRHLVRPGVTGWAQVSFGYADSEADALEKLSYDLYYVKHMSAWLDMQILGKSIWTVLTGYGAQ